MVNLNIRNNINELLGNATVNKNNNNFRIQNTSILKDMKANGEKEREIPGYGKVYFNYDSDAPYALYVPENFY